MLMLTVIWVGVWVGERDQQQRKACDWWRTSTSTSLFKLLFSTSRKQENIACNISDFFLHIWNCKIFLFLCFGPNDLQLDVIHLC